VLVVMGIFHQWWLCNSSGCGGVVVSLGLGQTYSGFVYRVPAYHKYIIYIMIHILSLLFVCLLFLYMVYLYL
jgi:hypothetical protein